MLDAPLADPHALLAANKQRLGWNARNIYAVASPVRTSLILFSSACKGTFINHSRRNAVRSLCQLPAFVLAPRTATRCCLQ